MNEGLCFAYREGGLTWQPEQPVLCWTRVYPRFVRKGSPLAFFNAAQNFNVDKERITDLAVYNHN